jgi:hypothetical protein
VCGGEEPPYSLIIGFQCFGESGPWTKSLSVLLSPIQNTLITFRWDKITRKFGPWYSLRGCGRAPGGKP